MNNPWDPAPKREKQRNTDPFWTIDDMALNVFDHFHMDFLLKF